MRIKMKNRYKMIIWAKAKMESLTDEINVSYDILNTLKKYDLFDELLLPASNKEKVKTFDIEKKNIEKLILLKQDKKFPNLGSQLTFFTSLNQEESLRIDFSVGRSNVKFKNAMTISFPIKCTSSQIVQYIELLKELVELYKSFYACITSNLNLRLYDDWYDYNNQIPKVIFWENYWGDEIISRMKIDDEMFKSVYEFERVKNGSFIRLQEKPLDVLNPEHIELQKRVNSLIKLK